MDLKDKENSKKNSTYWDSFRYAFIGIVTVFQEERNMRTHVLVGATVLLACAFLDLDLMEWLWISLSIFLVIVMEIWNTVIENVVDLATGGEIHPLAKKAKDMAAAAVLLTAAFSVLVAAAILMPKIWALFF